MVSVFTISFPLRHQLYPALVSFPQEVGNAFFAVRYLDGDMEFVFPGGRLLLLRSGEIESRICGPQQPAEAFAMSTDKAVGKNLNGNGTVAGTTKMFMQRET